MKGPCRKAFSETILEEAKKDKKIIVLCTDSKGSATLNDYAEELPEQFVEVGIAEQNCIGIAAGLANVGFKSFACGPASFYSMRSAEQVKVDVAYSGSNVIIIGISGGVSYGALGSTHHSLQDIALMNAIPDIKIILPSDQNQTRLLTKALVQEEGPIYVRMGRGAVSDIYNKEAPFTVGKANMLLEGEDLCIIAAGEMVYYALEAGEKLKEKHIHASVMDMHTIKPLDHKTLNRIAEKTNKFITVEEHSINGGLGSIVASYFSDHPNITVRKIALPDSSMVTGDNTEVFKHYGLTSENIVAQAECLLDKF